jgi:serine phosphatase RsbU (regulator of sigma subunit)
VQFPLPAYDLLIARGRPRGARPAEWSRAEADVRELRRAAGDLAASHLRLGRHLDECANAKRRLESEREVWRLLGVTEAVGDATRRVIQVVCECLNGDFGVVWMVDRAAGLLRFADCWCAPPHDAPALELDARGRSFAPGVNLPGRVWADDRSAWTADATEEAGGPRPKTTAAEGLRAAAAFPIRNSTRTIGVIEFVGAVREPDAAVLEMMACVGNQIGLFLERRASEGELRSNGEERRVARSIQQALWPKAAAAVNGLQIGGRSVTASAVGGDCFDVLPFPQAGPDGLGVLVADASGHGMGAALLIANTRAYVRAFAQTCPDAGTLLTLTNRCLADDIGSDHFVTAFFLGVVPRTRSLVYANAGHWPAYVLAQDGETRHVLRSTDIPLGIDRAIKIPSSAAILLGVGELVFLFTDGLVEAASPAGELFGVSRALGVVRAHRRATADQILGVLFAAVGDFSGHHVEDDQTAMVIKAEGGP